MFRRVRTLLPIFLLVSAAGAQNTTAPSAAGTVTPGVYPLEISFGGGVLEGLLTVPAPKDSASLKLMVAGHESPIRQTKRQGNRLILDNAAPGDKIHYELEFDGDKVKGSFLFGDGDGTVVGRRRPPEK
ncbi:MAG: hypothetical protein ABIZ70_06410 [Gemmatimonadales bacterium]